MKVITAIFWMCVIMLTQLPAAHSRQAPPTGSDTLTYRIETLDGNVFTGVIISRNDQQMVVQTQNMGQITIPASNIRSMQLLQPDNQQGEGQWSDNPQASRYLWAPNGYGLKEGQGYYQNVWVLFSQVNYGVNDRLSIGAGMIPLFLFAGTSTPLWVTAKVSVPVAQDHFNLGAGVLGGGIIGQGAGFGIAFGTGTLGTRDRNVSIGLGWGFTGEGWGRTPVINFSTMVRYSRRSYFISENYFIDQELILSAGGRSMIQKVSLDYGLIFPVTGGDFVAIPWLGLAIPFRGKNQ